MRDQLGNTRMVITDDYNVASPILEVNSYYPFGLQQKGIGLMASGDLHNEYTYNGNELQEELRFDQYDYDAQICMWHTVDPMAHEKSWVSPYNFVQNNPINRVDPTGALDMPPSTHLDDEGNVIAVFNDGDNSVYQQGKNAERGKPTEYMLSKLQEKWGTSAGGAKVGETAHWDEFVSPETGKTLTNYKVQLGKSFDPIISNMHTKAGYGFN